MQRTNFDKFRKPVVSTEMETEPPSDLKTDEELKKEIEERWNVMRQRFIDNNKELEVFNLEDFSL